MSVSQSKVARRPAGWKKAAVNIGMLGLSQVGVALAAFGTQVLLARSMSQRDFGSFMTVQALISLTAPLAVFGVSELWLQRFGREGGRAFRWVRPSVGLVIASSALMTAGMLVWSAMYWSEPAEMALRGFLTPLIVAQAMLALAMTVLQLRGDYRQVAVLQLAPHAGRVAVVLACSSMVGAAAGYGLVALLTMVLSIVILRPFQRGETLLEGTGSHPVRSTSGYPPRTAHLTAAATPFMLGSLFYLLGLYLGTVVAGELLGPESAAILAVPMSIIMAVYLIPRIVYQQYFLGKLHRWARSDRDAVLVAYKLGTTGMLVLGGVAGLMTALGGWIGIPLLFGPQYAASVPVMAVLCLAIPLRFGAASTAALLTSGSQVRRKVLYQGGGAAAYVLALALTIPAFGVYGAAIATAAAEAVLFWLFWTAVKKHVVAGAKLPSWGAIRGQLTGGTHGSAS